jgi:hypothetical protein
MAPLPRARPEAPNENWSKTDRNWTVFWFDRAERPAWGGNRLARGVSGGLTGEVTGVHWAKRRLGGFRPGGFARSTADRFRFPSSTAFRTGLTPRPSPALGWAPYARNVLLTLSSSPAGVCARPTLSVPPRERPSKLGATGTPPESTRQPHGRRPARALNRRNLPQRGWGVNKNSVFFTVYTCAHQVQRPAETGKASDLRRAGTTDPGKANCAKSPGQTRQCRLGNGQRSSTRRLRVYRQTGPPLPSSK